MASQLKVVVDWSSIPIWCCGKSFVAQEIFKHAQESHNKSECAMIDKSPGIKSKEAQVKINIDEDDTNNNSIPIANNEKSEDEKHLCDKCVYTAKRKSTLITHIENKHLGIRHECEVCHFRCASRNTLDRHRTKKHSKTPIEQDVVTTTPNSSQNENMNVAEIKVEIVTPPSLTTFPIPDSQSDIAEIKREIVTPPPPPEDQNDVAEMKQEIETASPAISDSHIDDVHQNREIPVLTEIKEEVDDENLQVPSWRILPEFEPPPLDEREELRRAKKDVDHDGVEEQKRILTLHAKLEKQEKLGKKRDAQWRKRLAEIQKLKEVKDKYDGKVVKMEGEDVEVLWPNEDLITDLVIVDDAREDMDADFNDTVQNTKEVVDDMEVVKDDSVVDGVGLDSDAVIDNQDVAAANIGNNSLSSENSPSN